MSVNQVTVAELYRETQGSGNLSIQALRTTIEYTNAKIVKLQQKLQELKGAYTLALQNMNRNYTKEELDKFFSPDRFQTVDPIQMIKPYDTVLPRPDARVNWNRRRMEEMIGEQKKELYRIEEEVKNTSSIITQLITKRDDSVAQLAKITDANIITNRDKISRMQYEIVYMLEVVSKRYRDLSTNANGERVFSSSPPITRQYKVLIDTFRSYASRDPDVKKGNLILLLEDPGCDENIKAIGEVLDRRRKVLADNQKKLPPDVEKVTKKMEADVNDTFISKNISRQAYEKRLPEPDNAITTLVDNADKMLSSAFTKVNNILSGLTPDGQNPVTIFGLNVNAMYDSTGFSGAVTNWFNRVMQNNYDGVPLCNQTDTSQAQAKEADNANKEYAELDASKLVASQFTKASSKVTQSTTEAEASLTDSIDEVIIAINKPSNPTSLWYITLDLDRKTYKSATKHDGEVLNQASQAADKALHYRNTGDIKSEDYTKYISRLQTLIEKGTDCLVSERPY